MADAKTTYQIAIEISDSLKALSLLQERTQGTITAIKREMQGLPESVKPARDGLAGFVDEARGYAKEQKQQGRLANFLTKDFLEFIPVAESAKGHVANFAQVLVEGAMGGATFGVAMEAVKFGVGLLADYFTRAKKEAEATEAAIKAIQDRIDEIGKSKRQRMLIEIGALQNAIDAVAAGDKGEKRYVGEGEETKSFEFEEAEKRLQDFATKYKVTVKDLTRVVAKLWEEYNAEESAERQKADIEAAQKAEKARAESAGRANTVLNKVREEAAKIGEARAKAELETYWKEVRAGLASDAMSRLVEPTTPYAKSGIRGRDEFYAGVDAKKAAEPVIDTDFFGKSEVKRLAPIKELGAALRELKPIADGIGNAFAGFFKNLITGAKSAGEAFAEMANAILETFLNMIAQMIAELIASSVLKLIGTILGGPGGGAAAGAVGGVIGIFEQGTWSVPRTGLALVHQGEKVIPAGQAAALGGASTVNVTINGPIDRAWWRAHQRDIIDQIRDASRNGRY